MRVEMSTNVPGISKVTNGSLTFYTVRVAKDGMRSTLGSYNTLDEAIEALAVFKRKYPPARMPRKLAALLGIGTDTCAAMDAHRDKLFALLETVPPHELDSTKATTVNGVKVPANVVEEYIYKKLI